MLLISIYEILKKDRFPFLISLMGFMGKSMDEVYENLQAQIYALCLSEFKKRQKEEGDNSFSSWKKLARADQLPPPGEWRVWLILAGRGFGKTRAGAETIKSWVSTRQAKRVALISTTIHEARDVMVEGVSGILSLYPVAEAPRFDSSKHRLTWKNGTIATLFGGDRFDRLRGPQFDAAWVDELAKFRYPEEAWNQLMLGLRLGVNPRCIVTTTPRPLPFLSTLMKGEGVALTRGTTFDNAANLSSHFIQEVIKRYEGTRLGFQELYGEILENQEGALWTHSLITYQMPPGDRSKGLLWRRVVIAIDPAVTSTQTSDETGILVVGVAEDTNAYVIEDLSGKWTPTEWGKRAVEAYWRYKADRIIAEVNNGGDLVEKMLRAVDLNVSFKAVHAVRGKRVRAEPVVALYEQRRVFHCRGFLELERQMCFYRSHKSQMPGDSPLKSLDRVDALVWALTELMIDPGMLKPFPKVWNAF